MSVQKLVSGMEKRIRRFEETTGVVFTDKSLLFQAFCHSSYANEHRAQKIHNNERLEFLGDAVLELVSSSYLYRMYPDMPEGKLTRMRASLVCEPTLADCARQINLQEYLLLGRGEEHTGGRSRNSVISDALEAVIGAIFLDGGFDMADSFIRRFVLNDIEHKKLFYDSKTVLQEVIQREYPEDELVYRIISEDGPAHDRRYRAAACVGDTMLGEGEGSTKKGAEMDAAYRALIELKQRGIHVS